jgi:hypothetical protein
MKEPNPETDIDALKAEHESVRRHLEHAREIADSVGEESVDELSQWLDHAIHTIAHQFLPHARHAETSLYARFPESPGAPPLAAVFRRDHVEFAQLVDELKASRANVHEPLAADVARDLRRILYGMYELMKLHFAAEESVYERAADQKTYRLRDSD